MFQINLTVRKICFILGTNKNKANAYKDVAEMIQTFFVCAGFFISFILSKVFNMRRTGLSTTHHLKVVGFRLWQTKGFYLWKGEHSMKKRFLVLCSMTLFLLSAYSSTSFADQKAGESKTYTVDDINNGFTNYSNSSGLCTTPNGYTK